MAKPRSKPRRPAADRKSAESSILAAFEKFTGPTGLKPGSILIRFTDSGEETSLQCDERGVSMARPDGEASHLVEVSGPAKVLAAIASGKKEASKAFLAGGIMVRGDLEYLEALLTDMGVLECSPAAVTRAVPKEA